MASLGIDSSVCSAADISQQANEIVNQVLLVSSPNSQQEDGQYIPPNPLSLMTITEQETPLPTPTNDYGYPLQELQHPLDAVGECVHVHVPCTKMIQNKCCTCMCKSYVCVFAHVSLGFRAISQWDLMTSTSHLETTF